MNIWWVTGKTEYYKINAVVIALTTKAAREIFIKFSGDDLFIDEKTVKVKQIGVAASNMTEMNLLITEKTRLE
jgi:hypothetical protein